MTKAQKAPATFDVVGIGNAIVDVIAQADDAFIVANKLNKNLMTLIDAERADELYARMGPGREISGGSCANTMAGIAALGGRAAYIGKVNDDQLGMVFRHDIRATGVRFDTPPDREGTPTARCLILVTPDALRTMNTYLGACVNLGPDDVDETTVAGASVTYLEGYLWDRPRAKEAFLRAARIAHQAKRRVSLTLSDPFCVDRHRESFLTLVRDHIDILFANEAELISLYKAPDFDAALQAVRDHCEIAVLTRGPKGSVIVRSDELHVIDAAPVAKVVDTTGAGDLYAAGFLYAFTQGDDLRRCGKIASLAAAEVIAHYGARPETDLKALVREKLG
ncbi:MAG: adenosine kinase [Alphaproteobacteria bacterium]|nr:adenosine kinase [Alphaproteobacteria bacterium]